MRVTQTGHFEVRGDVVFRGYFGNPTAPTEAFTPDGWFRTGDRVTIDTSDHLHLTGRSEDVININGVKFETVDVQTVVDQALSSLVERAAVFSARAPGMTTEQIVVVYVPKTREGEANIVAIEDLVVTACVMSTASRPVVFSLRPNSVSLLPTTTLDKISRAKMRSLLDNGVFSAEAEHHKATVQRHLSATNNRIPVTEAEALLLEGFAATIPSTTHRLDVGSSIFSADFTSMDLIRLKHRLDARLGISVPVITLLKHPTARSLTAALDQPALGQPITHESQDAFFTGSAGLEEYDPAVTLVPPTSTTNKTPLWLIHPGVCKGARLSQSRAPPRHARISRPAGLRPSRTRLRAQPDPIPQHH